ncbi:MAG: toprim domain-containing protein, partial [Anaerolineae bacterium]|nr:toprim domain-containing protein [Gemmatimonadaceae bacterium]
LWEVNSAAAEFFRRTLWEEGEGQPARDYLASRSLTRDDADEFELGFASRNADSLRSHLRALGYDDDRQLAAGLLARREDSGTLHPRFRGRVIFPIHDSSGRHAGFGGRLIEPGEPKYLNSSDTPAFSKTHLLYNLHRGKQAIRREDRVLVVEGYIDVVRVASAGIGWVVAPLGTAFTAEQAALLRRYTRNVLLLYDSDRAGLKATFRAADQLLSHELSVQVVTLPEGEDPDTFVARNGREALVKAMGQAIDVFERKIQLLERGGWLADLQKKRRALDRLLPTIRLTRDSLTRDLYLTRASEVTGVRKELLQREADTQVGRRAPPSAGVHPEEKRNPRIASRAYGGNRPRAPDHGASAERELVRVMLHYRDEIEHIAERIGPQDFHEASYKAIFEALLDSGPNAALDDVTDAVPTEAMEALRPLVEEPEVVMDVRKTVDDCLRRLECRTIQARFTELKGLQEDASDSDKDEYNRERGELQKRSARLGCKGSVGKASRSME